MRTLLGLLAVAGLLFVAAPAQRANAALLTPGVAASVQGAPASATTEVRWRRYGYAPRRFYGPRRYYAPRRYFAPRVYAPRFHRRYRY